MMVPEPQSERFLAGLPSGLTDFKLVSIGGGQQSLDAVVDALQRLPLRRLRLGGLATTTALGPRPVSWPAICPGLMSAAMGLALLAMA